MTVTPRTRATSPLRPLLRIAVLAGLAAAAGSAASAWVSLGESESTAYYLDPDSVRATGSQRRVWRLFDYKEPQRNGVHSGKALIEIDCHAGTYRYLKTSYYSEAMGKGRYLGGMGAHRKEYIGPGTMVGQLANAVCEPAGAKAPGADRSAAKAPVTGQPAAKTPVAEQAAKDARPKP